MDRLSSPLQFLLLVFSGWVNRQQSEVIDNLREETGPARSRSRIGGMLNSYYREAA